MPKTVVKAQQMEDAGKEGRDTCWLCDRALGVKVEWHHPLPKSRGGRQTVPVHPICHRTIHAHFTNAELASIGIKRDGLTARDDMARFLKWIAHKPADFHAPTRKPKGKH